MRFSTIYGVDFSGARLAGRNTWVARIERGRRVAGQPPYKLAELSSLEDLCGTAERAASLAHLVALIARSDRALWALDFPFGLPVEVVEEGARWSHQFDFLRAWGEDNYGVGLECIARAERLGREKHIRRLTDIEERAPFDPYHYRIIYQTFYGMRDVLNHLRRRRETAILPFQYRRLAGARRVLVEACPASTLKRLALPHQNYKQPEGGALTRKRLRTRRAILAGLSAHVLVGDTQRRRIMRNGGGDALDAVLAALGGALSWRSSDHAFIARHHRYPREGRLYV
ncbi:MAG: DUF429 domain-containing protein [Acidobacteria bacterium]|nr:DUF429 domain-containing protein [Acidobacteriota bacterium]MCA1642181.1 DUF429 domain-containing protein [Acidobacteriota bacterium]